MDQPNTTEATSMGTNLNPLQKGEVRASEMGKRGGARSTDKKKLAARIRELKKKYPFAQARISDLLSLLGNIDIFIAVSETELIELIILKEEAINKAEKPLERYKIQRDYIDMLAEIGEMFHGSDRIRHKADQKKGATKVPIEVLIAAIEQKSPERHSNYALP